MLEHKVEVRAYWSKPTLNKNHIVENSQEEIQNIIDEMAADEWVLTSTNAASFGMALYVYLYFSRNKNL